MDGIKDFYKSCDVLIEKWQNGVSLDLDPFLKKCKEERDLRKEEYLKLMPEPFWGDPENSLVVIINLNPGYSEDDEFYIGREVMKESGKLEKGYSSFARTNPYFTDATFHPAATSWWSKRLEWIHKVFECYNEKRLPFMLELCPWHSKKWAEVKINYSDEEQEKYIKDFVINAAKFAIGHATIPLIISIGKTGEILKQLGFVKTEKCFGPNNHPELSWPSRKDGKDKNVHFDFYQYDGDDIVLLNIWMLGSNHTPSDEFLDIEKSIIKEIKEKQK